MQIKVANIIPAIAADAQDDDDEGLQKVCAANMHKSYVLLSYGYSDLMFLHPKISK